MESDRIEIILLGSNTLKVGHFKETLISEDRKVVCMTMGGLVVQKFPFKWEILGRKGRTRSGVAHSFARQFVKSVSADLVRVIICYLSAFPQQREYFVFE